MCAKSRTSPSLRVAQPRAALMGDRPSLLERAGLGLLGWCVLAAGLALSGCRQDMHDQLKIEPLEGDAFFANGQGSRTPVDGTIARGQLKADVHLHEGRLSPVAAGSVGVAAGLPGVAAGAVDEPGPLVETFPFEVTLDVLRRGQ